MKTNIVDTYLKGKHKGRAKDALAAKIVARYLDQNPLMFLTVRTVYRASGGDHVEITTYLDLTPLPERGHPWTAHGRTIRHAWRDLADKLVPYIVADDVRADDLPF